MPQPGDKVSMKLQVSVQLKEYEYVNPNVLLTRVMPVGISEEEFFKSMEKELRRMVARGVLLQLGAQNDLYTALATSGLDGLVAFCQKEIGYVAQRPHCEVNTNVNGNRTKKPPTKKTAVKEG